MVVCLLNLGERDTLFPQIKHMLVFVTSQLDFEPWKLLDVLRLPAFDAEVVGGDAGAGLLPRLTQPLNGTRSPSTFRARAVAPIGSQFSIPETLERFRQRRFSPRRRSSGYRCASKRIYFA